MIVLLKLLIIGSVVGLLRSSEKFRMMSREFDEAAWNSLQSMMHTAEDSGYPSGTIPLLIAASAVAFMAMMTTLETLGR